MIEGGVIGVSETLCGFVSLLELSPDFSDCGETSLTIRRLHLERIFSPDSEKRRFANTYVTARLRLPSFF